MARKAKQLTANEVLKLSKIKVERDREYNVGAFEGSLLLRVRPNSAGDELRCSWLFKTRRDGKLVKKGLGTYTYSPKAGAVTLNQAREAAQCFFDCLKNGVDPKAKQLTEEKQELTVSEAIPKFFYWAEGGAGGRTRQWTNERTVKDAKRFFKTKVEPIIGSKKVNEVRSTDVADIVGPIMLARFTTGGKAKGFLHKFFSWCMSDAVCLRDTALGNPANGAALTGLIPKESQCERIRNHGTCHWSELPRFVRLLVEDGGLNSMRGMALMFALLTASRSGNVMGGGADRITYAEWRDINFREGRELWDIPAEKMKERQNGNHRVPLSRQAVAILRRIEKLGMRDGDAVFVSRFGTVVREQAALDLIHRISKKDVLLGGNGFKDPQSGDSMTVHGAARACFQTWAIDEEVASYKTVEAALHHSIAKYDGAYLRTDLEKKRRPLMQKWADFLFSECPPDWYEIKA